MINLEDIKTPLADLVLSLYHFETKEGFVLNTETAAHGHKIIMECILARRAPTGNELEIIKRIHVMAHTRYGKSLAIAAALSVRASSKGEPWAIVAGSKDQAQIIMDYVIQFSVNDPIIKRLLVNEKEIKIERLTQRRKRDHLTYKMGGEIRAYGAGKDGTAVMGQGCPNVVEDESGLINDNTQSKIFRMLGDHMDNFYMKVGNPFNNNHFKDAFISEDYFHINIDFSQGIKDGRLNEKFVQECRNKPNFSILYENIFPDADLMDVNGYLPLFTHALLNRAQVNEGEITPWGACRDGCDPADNPNSNSGNNESIICRRWANVAKVIYQSNQIDNIQFATEIATRGYDSQEWHIDTVGVGSGTYNLLKGQMVTKYKAVSFKGGGSIPKDVQAKDINQFINLRAYCFWQLKLWLEGGGKIVKHDDWKKLLMVKYKTNDSKIQVISKAELRKEPYKISDLGVPDALSMTFSPFHVVVASTGVRGGVAWNGNMNGSAQSN